METRTWIIGDLKSNGKKAYRMALCLADGAMHLIAAGLKESETVWSTLLPVKGELFGLSKFNLTVRGLVLVTST